VLQTAASLENLIVATYTSAADLPFAATGGLPALISRNLAHHKAHAQSFNRAVAKAGGAPQHAADPRYAASVVKTLNGTKDPSSLVSLLNQLEDIIAQTCTRYASLAAGGSVRTLFVNVASVEAQHSAELLIVRTLFDGGYSGPGGTVAAVRAVPAAVGTVCIPHAAYPTADASAINEGEVR
jgi:tRNA isopentenyl-2-thiomethyl-A-37 hydroxylase MiaE